MVLKTVMLDVDANLVILNNWIATTTVNSIVSVTCVGTMKILIIYT